MNTYSRAYELEVFIAGILLGGIVGTFTAVVLLQVW
jgi:hypothetical protein